MDNITLIVKAALNAGIFTENQVKQYLQESGDIPLHTFKGWKERGYNVRKGQKAKLKCDIWRYKKQVNTVPAKKENGEETEQEIDTSHYYKKLSAFFTGEQVERVQQGV